MEDLDVKSAKKVLQDSLNHLIQRKGHLTTSDIEADVMNVAALSIMKEDGYHRIETGHDNAAIMRVMPDNYYHFSDDVMIFIQAAGELHPTIFRSSNFDNYVGLIIKNVSWTGFWDFLKNYFKDKHNIVITK